MNLNTEFIEQSKTLCWLLYISAIILISTLLFGFIYSVILALFIKTKKAALIFDEKWIFP